jgi:hypothetical protein
MNTNALAVAHALPDRELLARLETLARNERQTCAELIAHLAALDERASLYAARATDLSLPIAGKPSAYPRTRLAHAST